MRAKLVILPIVLAMAGIGATATAASAVASATVSATQMQPPPPNACPTGLTYDCVYANNDETGTETTYALTVGPNHWSPTKVIGDGRNAGSAINHSGHDVWYWSGTLQDYICTVAGQGQTLNHSYGWMDLPSTSDNNCTENPPNHP